MHSVSSGSIVATSKQLFSRGRYSLFAVVAFLVVLTPFLSACDTESLLSSSSSEQSTALRVLDDNAQMLAHVSIESGLSFLSALSDGHISDEIQQQEEYQEFIDMTGLDPLEDIHSVYVSMSNFEDYGEGSVLVFAEFDQTQMVSLMESEGEFSRVSSAAQDAFQVDDDDMFVALHEGRYIMLSSSDSGLNRLVDRMLDETISQSRNELIDELSTDDHWMIIQDMNEVSNAIQNENLSGPLASMGQLATAVEKVGFGLSFTSEEIDSRMVLVSQSDTEASDLESLLKGLRAAARFEMGDQEDLLELINEIEISSSGSFVEVAFEAEVDEIREWTEKLSEESFSALRTRIRQSEKE